MSTVVSLSLGISKLTFWGNYICFLITLIRMLPPSSLQLRILWPLQKASWLTFAQILPGKVTARVQQHVPLIKTHRKAPESLSEQWASSPNKWCSRKCGQTRTFVEYSNTGAVSLSFYQESAWHIVHAWDNTEMAAKFHVVPCHSSLPLLLLYQKTLPLRKI